MESWKRICLVAPSRWAGSVAMAMRQQNSATPVVSVANAATGGACIDLHIASDTTSSLVEGLRGADLVLVAQSDTDPEWSLQNVISSCGSNATICGHGRSLAEVNGLIRDLSRNDVHYVSFGARGSLNPNGDLAESSLTDVRGQSIVLTPSKIDDLDALSLLQESLQQLGAHVVAMSPRVHDRQLIETVHLPRVFLFPLVQYLAESVAGKNATVSSETVRLLEMFSVLTSDTGKAWSEELSRGRHHLLAALDQCIKDLGTMREELATGQLHERVRRLSASISELSPSKASSLPVRPVPQPVAVQEQQSMDHVLGSLLSAMDRLSANPAEETPAVTTAMLRELAERAQSMIERMSPPRETVSHDRETAVLVLEPVVSVGPSPEMPEAAPALDAAPEMWNPEQPTPLEHAEPAGPRSFDIQCRHDLHVVERMARVMNGVHIAVTSTEEMWSDRGDRIIRVTLDDSQQIDRARELLRMAGIPLA